MSSGRAAIYCRISDDRTGAGLGVERQRRDCEQWAEQRGVTVLDTYVDNDIGAWNRRRVRPAYRQMLEQVHAGVIDTIIVWHMDRLYRDTRELEDIIDLAAAGRLTVASVTGGDFDLNNTDGQLIARILVSVARKESDDKSRRTRRKHLELAENGRPVGGPRPFGFNDNRVTLHPVEAALIAEACQRILNGASVYSIAKAWNEAGVPTPRGNAWSLSAVRRVLTSERITGARTLKGQVTKADAWPAIVDPVTFRRVGAVIASRRGTGGFGPRKYVLTGLAHCGRCDRLLVANVKDSHGRTYVCTSRPGRGGCGGLRIAADKAEQEVVARLFAVVDDQPLRDLAEDSKREVPILAELAELEARAAESTEAYAAGELPRAAWVAAQQGIERRINAAKKRLAEVERERSTRRWAGQGQLLESAWRDMDVQEQRTVLDAWIDHITIGPGTRGHFDPDRIHVTWRE